jgi:hypothetical protein
MSALTLMDRPTGNRTLTIKGVGTSDIVDMGTYGKWAAFNVGVDVAASQVATPAAKALLAIIILGDGQNNHMIKVAIIIMHTPHIFSLKIKVEHLEMIQLQTGMALLLATMTM